MATKWGRSPQLISVLGSMEGVVGSANTGEEDDVDKEGRDLKS